MSVRGVKIASALCVEAAKPLSLCEAELIERARTEPQAFGNIYELYYSRILNYLYRRTLDVSIAEELTSNTFFKALRGLSKYRNRGAFGAWLYRIATNETKMHWRSQRNWHENNPQWQEEFCRIYFASHKMTAEEDEKEKMQRFAQLHASINSLLDRYQTVLVLRYFEEMQYDEIAKVLEKRIGTVKSLIHRGLKQLKRQMES